MPSVRFAAVIELTRNGEAIIQFDCDLQPSQKIYKSLKSYEPAVGDRVMIVENIIVGGFN